MGDILKGRIPNKLVPLKHKVDGRWVDLGLGTISPIRDDAGNVQLRIFTRLDEPQYKISPYKELFTDKEIERLETDGHLGSTKKMKDFTSGRECECYVSVHEATNRLTTLPVDALTLPTRIYGKEIGDDIEALRAGVTLISQKFTDTLRQKGVTEIDVKGREFDADLCEAVAKFAAGEEMQGKVVDIVQTGYMLGDKVLRFAKVVVGEFGI